MPGSTKNLILNYLSDLTQDFDFTKVNHFTAKSISDEMYISRSLASQYLNELVKEKLIMKVNSRPVYFLHRKKMEELFNITFQDDDFYDLEEVKQYIKKHAIGDGDYSKIIGYDKSLAGAIKQLQEGFEYPPSGLPIVLYGEKGTGKRTLSKVIYDNAARKGKIASNAKVLKLEFSSSNSEELLTKLFGNSNNSGLIESYNQLILIIANGQHMSEKFQEQLCQLMEANKDSSSKRFTNKGKMIRYLILSDVHPIHYMIDRLLKNIPIIINLPSLKDKSKEELEELIIHFLKNEGQKMNKVIKINNVILRALVSGTYARNMADLKSTIQLMCASALRLNDGRRELIIKTHDLPEYLLKTLPIVSDEELIYIDTTTYQRSEQIDFILDYFQLILKPFVKIDDFQEALFKGKHNFDLLSEFLSHKQRITPERIKGIEISLNNIINVVLKKRYINLPSGFSATLAKLLYIHEIYVDSITKWQQKNRSLIDSVLMMLKENCMNEAMIVEEIARLLNSNLEIEATDFLTISMLINLRHYNQSRKNQKVFGLIVCHGYSTATSIAEAANSLLENYIFDAVDMPLDIEISEVKELILEKLNNMHSNADVIVMVDMGSLEQLGNSLSSAINCSVGVINNVSTRLALNVGNAIVNEQDMVSTLQEVSENSKANYTIINRKKNDAIVFTSESGIQTAQRMRELFESSLPTTKMPIDLVVCDYNQLVTNSNSHEIFSSNNVLFITGTSNPHVLNHEFVALEDIISGNNIDMIMNRLRKYLDIEELNLLLQDLRKNFTLLNVVGYLTILNPKILLDNVSMAIEVLQDHLHQKFSGKTLIGIYIHVCCLIERLVTKTAIIDFENLEDFEKVNQDFIRYIHESFSVISKRYNIQIPNSEIAYLYDFIASDQKK